MKKEFYLDINEAYLIDLIELLKKHPEGLLDVEICEILRISSYRLTLLRVFFEKKREELDFQKKIFWRKNKVKIEFNFLKYKHEQDIWDFLQAISQSSMIFQFVSTLLQYENTSVHNMSNKMRINERKLRKVSRQVKDDFRRFSLIVSEKGFRLDGDEGVIRELLFQFWWQAKSQNCWPDRFVNKKVIKQIVDKMISRLTTVAISKSTYEELYLRLGIQLLRVSTGYQCAKPLDLSLYLKASKQYRKFCQCVKEHEALNNLRTEEVDYLYSLFIYLGVISLTALNLENNKTKSCFDAVSALVDSLS
ncbi:MAG: helix-turn-helix domain-containing protein, partial [Streptococcaceae bacterium]|nr:helix-turn-helix domain-containing protein [Streptococcaceae bacterium]